MINSKEQYHHYLKEDLKMHGYSKWKIHYGFTNTMLLCQRKLRHIEYLKNCRKDFIGKFSYYILKYRFKKHCIKLGFTIGENCFGPGLRLAHYGSIAVNGGTRVGANCVIHTDVNIGIHKGECPTIGDNVYIGPGAKIFGGIVIGDNVRIGANAVVNKNVSANKVVVGIPAKEIVG
ncbi:serine acetyltransferase [Shouchella shacheensis]|uniref:serine acetyltransferase n=1 Tax=Shouchella shacheensis TaxID=1649580 RepID=UPI00073FE4B3|nr:DapH/DapD/GlmU-related protein [Shouchella shacheensis]